MELGPQFAVVTATHRRADGSTPRVFARAARAVASQLHVRTHVTWFIVGDCYPEPEFSALLADIPAHVRTVTHNMPEPGPKDWAGPNAGGILAINKALALAEAHGIAWCAHLDDDDVWEADHIHWLLHAARAHPAAHLVHTQGQYLRLNCSFPTLPTRDALAVNAVPLSCNVLHSAVAMNLAALPESLRRYVAHDAVMWERIRALPAACCVSVPVQTVYHLSERGSAEVAPAPSARPSALHLAVVHAAVGDSLAAAASWLADMARDMAGHTFHHHFALLHGLCDVLVGMGVAAITYAEIGTFCGGSLCFALQHSAVAEAHAIDPLTARAGAPACVAANLARWNTRGVPVHVTRALSTDPSVRDAWRRDGTRVHVLFIDGDHSHAGVTRDFELFRDFVHPGGFVVFDDYFDAEHSPQVRGAVDDIVRTQLNNDFHVIGTFANTANVPPASMPQLNEFVLQRALPPQVF
jgi:hypothetical protein